MIKKLFSKIFGAQSSKPEESTSISTTKEIKQKSELKKVEIKTPVDYSNLSREDQFFKAVSSGDEEKINMQF